MAKYRDYGADVEPTGNVHKVQLIPEVEGAEGMAESQKYLVKEGELAEDVLSAAAINHEEGVKINLEPPKAPEPEPEAVSAKIA